MADSTSQLDATINALQGGLSNAAGAAGPNIQGWITTLQGNTQLSGISSELKKLETAISSGDSSTIASSLSTLGEHTTKRCLVGHGRQQGQADEAWPGS
ncbi:MAG: hypothetical protein WKG07_43510 [Hymenobacter sp.]